MERCLTELEVGGQKRGNVGREMIQRTSGSVKMKTGPRGSSGDGATIKQAVRAAEV